jgi:putative ABC transport system ATP-binding protein
MDEPTQPLIVLEGLGKVHSTDEIITQALCDLHLTIARGEFVSISGPSGSGKSTLLSILGLLDTPTSGRYELAGRGVDELGADDRAELRNREIGFIFQSFNLIADLTVYENVELPLVYRRMAPKERRLRVREVLERVDMTHRLEHMPGQLSGGQQQRVAVARAVVGRPSVVLADEPTGNLDSQNSETVMELLRELNRAGSTIVMVTHDPRCSRYAARVVNLFDGRIISESSEAAA